MVDCKQGFDKNAGFGAAVGAGAEAAGRLAAEALDLHKGGHVLAKADGLSKDEISGLTKHLDKGLLNHIGKSESDKEATARAEHALDKKVDQKDGLSEGEKRTLKQLEHSILEGRTGALKAVLQAHKDNPKALANIMHELRADMKEQGLIVSYSVGQMGLSPDYNMHDVGMMRIFRESGGKALEVSTEARLGTNVGGPVKKQADGSYIDYGMGLFGTSPAEELADMGKSAVRRINHKPSY